jgi:GDP-L-fucose synthase
VLSALIRKIDEARERKSAFVELWGSGTPRREFIHADDLADACCFLLRQNLDKIGFPINIGTGVDYSIQELAAIIARVLNYHGDIRWDRAKPDGAPRKLLDDSRLRALGWKPKVDLEGGIRMTYQWYERNRSKIERDTLPI